MYSFGSDLRWCDLGGIRVSETLMPANLTLDVHAHERAQLCFILEGRYRETSESGDHKVVPGMLLVHRPREHHSDHFDEESLTLLISIEPSRWLHTVASHPRPVNALLSELTREVREELRSGSDSSRAALEGLALLILARASTERTATEPEWLRGAIAYIEHHYNERISLASIAEDAGVHRATLAAAFRRFRNTSAGEYLRDVRLHHAMYALTHSSMPISEIASITGFADQSHFGRIFKRAHGVAPSDFRLRDRRSA